MEIIQYDSTSFDELKMVLEARGVTQKGSEPIMLEDGGIAVLLWNEAGGSKTAVGIVLFSSGDNNFDRAELLEDFADHQNYATHLISTLPEAGKAVLKNQQAF